MIDAKEAFLTAKAYFVDLFKGSKFSKVVLEEAEMTEDGIFWLITISYFEPNPDFDMFAMSNVTRKYKQFKISTKDGSVISMTIRKVD